MANFNIFIFVFLISGLLSFVITKLVIILAKRWNIIDQPQGGRKIHSRATPLLGGLAIYLALAITAIVLWQNNLLFDIRVDQQIVWWFFVAGLLLVINGVLDDKYNLPAKFSIWGPILASLIVILAGLKISYVTHPTGGVLYLDKFFVGNAWFWLSGLLTFTWLMAMTYTTKLLDGIDGLASGIGLIAATIIFVISLAWDVSGSTTSLLTLGFAGALLGFLIWNWHPAKIFLGEGGSTLIGFTLGVLAIISGSKIATALLVMGLPILDIIWVIIRRLRQKKAVWRGDSGHLHFRLLRAGFSQQQIVFFLGFISLLFGLVSIMFTTKAKIGALVILLAIMFVLTYWLNFKTKQNENT